MRFRILVFAIAVAGTVCCSPNLKAQRPEDFFNGFGNGFTPDQFTNRMFAPPTEEEAAKLDKISISAREESEFGKNSFQAFQSEKRAQGIRFLTRGPRVEYLQELAAKLKPQLTNARRYRRLQLYVADTDELDGRSFPGGHIIVTRGMMDFCDSEAALLGVLGHELSHLDRQHQLLPLKRSKLAQSSFSGRDGFSFSEMMGTMQLLSQTWTRPFRPEDEQEADNDGADWVFHAGYDPREFAKLFIKLSETRPEVGRAAPAFLRTHPFDEERYNSVMDRYRELVAEDRELELTVGAASHQERVRAFRASEK